MEDSVEIERPRTIFRRYFCDYCGICRSKKSLINFHIQTQHKEEMDKVKANENEEMEVVKSNACQECGAIFKKPAYLKQHMQSHSLLRPYVCSVDDCHASYRRKDHLTRHLLTHEGKLFKCPTGNCNIEFVFQGNVKRHVKELHSEDSPSAKCGQKQRVCQETGCGKVFRYPSRLRKHEDSHVKLESVEAFCAEPGCCDVRFAYKHVRDKHEQSGCHVYTPGDFEESDEQFRSRPQGGRKRKCPTVEMLIRKRVTPPTDLDPFHAWFQSNEGEDQ
ncbi:hypothetical protein GH714_022237 [Hevea brasiliensis]|uniref:C2H2-type domain-containing protein n=1 Tax=Hevea brasiliensis TaxID=3981 RepID=A0A6A6N007_HEVBR|nr:hypothetical protein GH714_022237 [Hevea brasiliensis]